MSASIVAERAPVGGPSVAALPSRSRPRGDDALQALFDLAWPAPPAARGGIGQVLHAGYDGDLWLPLRADRPAIVANLVETLDGVVALDGEGASGGGEVSGFNPADRFIMALLRSLADAVVVGAATVRASNGGPWTAERIRPDLAVEFADLRRRLGLAAEPTTIVVTGSGRIDPTHPGFRNRAVPVVIAGSDVAVERLHRSSWPANVRIEPLPGSETLGEAIVEIARGVGARLVLSEAGPHVTGQLIGDGVLDEVFLTVSPQLAGRGPRVDRLSLVEGQTLWPASPRWLQLQSVRRGTDHLFLRYRFEEGRP